MRGWMCLVLVLAGCASAPGQSGEDGLEPPDVETGPDLGAISGVVVTEAIVPVPNASVRLVSSALQAQTDQEGRFVFRELAPGPYFLNVSAPGFHPVQTSAVVAAGEVAKLRVLVSADPSPQPWHQTLAFNGFIQGYVGIASYVVQLLANDTGLCECQFEFQPGPGVHTFVYEATWEATVQDPLGDEMYWELDSQDPLSQQSAYDPSPILQHIKRDAYPAEATTWMARLTGDFDWPAVDQDYEMFVTNFYLAPPPEDWSLVAGDN